MLTAEQHDQLVIDLARAASDLVLGSPYDRATRNQQEARKQEVERHLMPIIERVAKDAERRGFIEGAVVGATVEDARWAIQNDMNGARVLRDDARETGDEVLWRNVRHFVTEARMWSQIARLLLRRQREEA